MNIDGFNLLLQDFCSYCPDFEPEVEQIDYSPLCEPNRCVNNIQCANANKCSRIVENLEKRVENSR